MNKYYVTWGSRQIIVMAGNQYAACIKVMEIVFRLYVDEVATMFRVSQRGHDEHCDDEFIELSQIIQIQMMSNNFAGLENDSEI